MTGVKILLFLTWIMAHSCSSPERRFVRTIENYPSENFIYLKNSIPDSNFFKSLALEVDSGFRLESITKSPADLEIRIFYTGNWLSRFFREIIRNDIATLELHQCRVIERQDSIFMKTGIKIRSTGPIPKQILKRINELPNYYRSKKDTIPYLDNVNHYYIQIKSGLVIKMIAVNNPFEYPEGDHEGKLIADFLEEFSQVYSFQFYDEWPKIDSSAFN